MHISNDITEKLSVALVGISLLALLVFVCSICSHHSDPQSSAPQLTTTDDADDFEGEFLRPSVPVLSEPATNAPKHHLVQYEGRYFSYGRAFADRNDKHLSAAEQVGLSHGPDNREEASRMRHQLREIKTNKYYVVEELTHSLPYLVPTAANRLDSIGEEFADILARNNLPEYRFRVTSVLRSGEDIRRLKRCNSNSIDNSPHNYGTTFDLGYAHFDKVQQTIDSMADDNLKLVLAQTLLNQQRAGHIYVKYEHKQGCFHVTARN